MPVRCKLCGIRSRADLEIGIQAGADALGFICGVTHISEDALSEDAARDLVRLAPPYISTVLVTHLEDADDILRLADFLGVDTIQVHGLVDAETMASVFAQANGRRVTKAVHVTGSNAVEEAEQYLDVCHALQLDSRTSDRLGGTGELHDWSISRRIVEMAEEKGQRPVVLSGGLRPTNVADAIATVRPYAVDVNSGVDGDDGDKDPELAAAFVSAARSASA
jgi:phosphoribosylanthranilate isomerase